MCYLICEPGHVHLQVSLTSSVHFCSRFHCLQCISNLISLCCHPLIFFSVSMKYARNAKKIMINVKMALLNCDLLKIKENFNSSS